MPIPLERLQPGDVLLYRGGGLFSQLIRIKTWSRFSHVEIYDGDGWSWASRNGIGVNRYPVRVDDLDTALRLRPWIPFDMVAARAWALTVQGQGYDWVGLLSFIIAKWQGRENQKQFCSEFAARMFRYGISAGAGLMPAGDRQKLDAMNYDPWRGRTADAIAPQGFDDSPMFREVV